LLVLSLLTGMAFSWVPFIRWMLVIEAAIYIFGLLAVGILTGLRRRRAGLIAGVPISIACMHLSWGSGFLWSMITTNRAPPK
jgi:hypothetical protein